MSHSSYQGGDGKGRVRPGPDVTHIQNPDVTHEHSDVPVGPIAKFVVGLFIFAIVVHLLMLLLFNVFQRRELRGEREPSPLARVGDERLPPEPRLQASKGYKVEGQLLELKEPQAELIVVRQLWQEQLTTYGWVDQNAGTVRIPIEQAKQLLLKREEEKARSRPPQQGEQRTAGESIPADSSSGRTTEKRNQ